MNGSNGALAVTALTPGRTVPSARFRVRQYIEPLRARGVVLTEHAPSLGAYPPATGKALRPLWAAASLVERLPGLLASRRADLSLIQRQLISTYNTLEAWTGQPRALDVDDAVWARPRGEKIPALARACAGVICGNAFLADYFSQHNSQTAVVPTAVDTARFHPSTRNPAEEKFVIGWSGSHTGLPQLYGIEAALAEVLAKVPTAELLVTSDRPPQFDVIAPARVRYVPWSVANEVATLQSMDVGLMPLEDSTWNRGKCSYKMLLYMACGLPVLVSPVGMNVEVLAHGQQMGEVGGAAVTLRDWSDALVWFANDKHAARALGAAGRRVVEANYSLGVVTTLLAEALFRFAGR